MSAVVSPIRDSERVVTRVSQQTAVSTWTILLLYLPSSFLCLGTSRGTDLGQVGGALQVSVRVPQWLSNEISGLGLGIGDILESANSSG